MYFNSMHKCADSVGRGRYESAGIIFASFFFPVQLICCVAYIWCIASSSTLENFIHVFIHSLFSGINELSHYMLYTPV